MRAPRIPSDWSDGLYAVATMALAGTACVLAFPLIVFIVVLVVRLSWLAGVFALGLFS